MYNTESYNKLIDWLIDTANERSWKVYNIITINDQNQFFL